MKSLSLEQYAAVYEFVRKSRFGVTWDEISEAVGHRFESPQDAADAAGVLLVLGYLGGTSYGTQRNGKSCLLPERVAATRDGSEWLRELRNVVGSIQHNYGRCYSGDLQQGTPSASVAEAIRHLSVMKILTVTPVSDDVESPKDQVSLSNA